MELFYGKEENGIIILDNQEATHCIKAKRYTIGEIINITDGQGYHYISKISALEKNVVYCQIIKKIEKESIPQTSIIIAIAPPKHPDRMEWMVEKATEIGVDEIVPIKTERAEKFSLRYDRLEKILIAASKQSLRFRFPKLHQIIDLKNFLNTLTNISPYIAYCGDIEKHYPCQIYEKQEKQVVFIGPEGDFSPNEIKMFEANKGKFITLGNNRLRTETAAIVALAQLMQCQTTK